MVLLTANAASQVKTITLLDAETQRPIPFANVMFVNSLSGTSTDMAGKFELPQGLVGKIQISSLGYRPLELTVDTLKSVDRKGATIYLVPYVYGLNEFSIQSSTPMNNPREIVKIAIKKIPDNYCQSPMVLNGYYQDIFQNYETLKTEDIISKEVSMKVPAWFDTTITINVERLKQNSESDFWLNFRYNNKAFLPQYHIPDYGNNHLKFLMNMDPVRNHDRATFDFVKCLDKDFLKNHWFRLKGMERYNNRNTYVIFIALDYGLRSTYINYFEPNYTWKFTVLYPKTTDGMQIQSHFSDIGMIFIDVEDLAIVRMDYLNGYFNDRYKYSVEYVKQGDKYYLSKLYFGNKFRMSPDVNFSVEGEKGFKGLWCEKAQNHYKNSVKSAKESGYKNSNIRQIVKNNTIRCPISYTRNYSGKPGDRAPEWVRSIIAISKSTEDVLDSTLLRGYGKYFHHRLFYVNSISLNQEQAQNRIEKFAIPPYTEFTKQFRFLGDTKFDWFLGYNRVIKTKKPQDSVKLSKAEIFRCIKFKRGKISEDFPFIPFPITASDELRYFDTLLCLKHITPDYDKIKGFLYIDPHKEVLSNLETNYK